MKRSVLCVIFFSLALFVAAGAAAKDTAVKYKVVELKPFTIAEGVAFPPDNIDPKNHLDALYEHFTEDLQKQKIAEQVITPGGAVTDADAADAVVIEGKITAFAKNGRNMAHPSVLTMQIVIYRRSDHTPILTINPEFKMLWETCVKEKYFGQAVANWSIFELKKALR